MGQNSSLCALASGLGSCCATGFCTIATAGTVDAPRGVRCLLLWVNMIFLACAVLLQRSPQAWLGSTCSQLKSWFSFVDTGICQCELLAEGVDTCRQQQATLRLGFAAEVVFLFLMLMGISGCASSAGRKWPVMKFLALPALFVCFCFVPNALFDAWHGYIGYFVAAFAVFEAVVVMDIMYYWNTTWFEKSRQGQLRHDEEETGLWKWLLVLFSLGFLGFAGYLTFDLYSKFPEGNLRAVIFGTLAATLVLTFISILEKVKHGALIVSAAFVLYAQCVAWQVVAAAPATGSEARAAGPQLVVEAALAVTVLIWAAIGQDNEVLAAPAQPQTMQLVPVGQGGDVEAAAVAKAGADGARVLIVQKPEEEAAPPPLDTCDFIRSCLTQFVATAYVTYLILPLAAPHQFLAELAALCVVVLLYGWSLVAPSLLTGRRFD